MNDNTRKAAADLVAGHREALASGVEGNILRQIIPSEMYDSLMAEIDELHTSLSDEQDDD